MKKNNKINFIIIFILISLYYFMYVYNESNLSFFNKRREGMLILFLPTLLIILLNINKIKKILKKLMWLLFFLIILNQYYYSFYILLIMVFFKKRKTLKYILYTSSFFYILTIFLYYSNILIRNEKIIHYRIYNGELLYRHMLGFQHPNFAMILLFPIFTSIYYLYYNNKNKNIMMLFFFIVSSGIFFLTYSRTTFLTFLFFILLIKIKDKYILKFKNIVYFEVIMSLITTFIIPIFFYSEGLNRLLSMRLFLFREYISNYKISFLGSRSITKLYSEVPLDNLYLRIYVEQGIIGIVLFIFLIIIMIKVLYKEKDTKAIRILIIIILFSNFEAMGFEYWFNILLYIIPSYIFSCYSNNKINKSFLD